MVLSSSSPRSSLRFGRPGRRWGTRVRLGFGGLALVASTVLAVAWMRNREPAPPAVADAPVEPVTQERTPAPLVTASRETVIEIAPSPIADPEIAADARLPEPPPASPAASAPPASGNADLEQALALASSDPVESRRLLSKAVDSGSLATAERDRAYALCDNLMRSVFLNPKAPAKDPSVRTYTVASGDSLERIVRSQGLSCDWRLLQRMNGLADPRKIRVGQKLRVPVGTFHAEVLKSQYRLNLFLGEGPGRTLVASFRVGLGTDGGTPTGMFRVRKDSKLVDPEWTHPDTGEHFRPNDPKNPIGEWWIGIEGVEDGNREKLGFGIHGTIEPDSIGADRSLGCVRLLNDDVAIVYATLTEPESTILIRP